MNDRGWKSPEVFLHLGACPNCDYWWAKNMLIDECMRCWGTGLDQPIPPLDMIK